MSVINVFVGMWLARLAASYRKTDARWVKQIGNSFFLLHNKKTGDNVVAGIDSAAALCHQGCRLFLSLLPCSACWLLSLLHQQS